jgi:hypothetical protein
MLSYFDVFIGFEHSKQFAAEELIGFSAVAG